MPNSKRKYYFALVSVLALSTACYSQLRGHTVQPEGDRTLEGDADGPSHHEFVRASLTVVISEKNVLREREPIAQFLVPVARPVVLSFGRADSGTLAVSDRPSDDIQFTDTIPDDKIYMFVPHVPEFPGGRQALEKFIQDSLTYPDRAKKRRIEGTVYVNFLIRRDGSITDVKVLRGLEKACDEEAVRVIRSMPKWNPGRTEEEKAVTVRFNLPVRFRL